MDKEKKPKSQITRIVGDGSHTGGNGADPAQAEAEVKIEPRSEPDGQDEPEGSELLRLTQQVEAQGAALMRVIQHLQNAGSQQNQPLLSMKERRDMFEQLTDPADDLLPALTDVSPLMATLIPAMNVIKWNYTPRKERPLNPLTRRPYGMYLLWELDFARWSLSKNAHNAIRLCDVVQTRPQEQGRMGMVAE